MYSIFILFLIFIHITSPHPLFAKKNTSILLSETIEQAAQFARILLHTTDIGTLMTIMAPEVHQDLQGYPFGVMDYYADECPSTGDLLLLVTGLGVNAKNFHKDERVTFTVRKELKQGERPMEEKRVVVLGTIERTEDREFENVKECFLAKHPDSKSWVPGGNIPGHNFQFYRLHVKGIYYIGGFGGIHYIGWIPEEIYRAAYVNGNNDEMKKENLIIQS